MSSLFNLIGLVVCSKNLQNLFQEILIAIFAIKTRKNNKNNGSFLGSYSCFTESTNFEQ